MRILIVTHYFPPFNVVASQRPYSWAKVWALAGHEVTVLTARHPSRVEDLSSDFAGVEVIPVDIPLFSWLHQRLNAQTTKGQHPGSPRKLSLLRRFVTSIQMRYGIFITSRMPDVCDLWIRPATAEVSQRQFDLVVSTSGPYACHLVARRLKKKTGAYWVADFRDLWTQGHIFPGLFPFTVIERWLEARCLREADLVTTVSVPLAATLKATGLPQRVEVIENGYNPDDLKCLSPQPFWPADGKCRLVYTGTIYGGKQDLSPLFSAVHYLHDSGYTELSRLELVFATKQLDIVHRCAEEYDVLPWVQCYGYVSRQDALRMQRDAHALLFLEFRGEKKTEGILTGKIFEYLSSGTEILGIGTEPEDSVGNLLLEAQVGKCMGKDVKAIGAAIVDLIRSSEKRVVSCRPEILVRYDRRELARRMLSLAHGARDTVTVVR